MFSSPFILAAGVEERSPPHWKRFQRYEKGRFSSQQCLHEGLPWPCTSLKRSRKSMSSNRTDHADPNIGSESTIAECGTSHATWRRPRSNYCHCRTSELAGNDRPISAVIHHHRNHQRLSPHNHSLRLEVSGTVGRGKQFMHQKAAVLSGSR